MSMIATSPLWRDSAAAADAPAVQLMLMRDGRWRVGRAGDDTARQFDRPEQAEAFIRARRKLPVIVELQIGELYIAATLIAGRGRLFGAVRR